MNTWRGLHNPERHDEMPLAVGWCNECGNDCWQEQPCRCCLATEVEHLNLRIQAALNANAQLRGYIQYDSQVAAWQQVEDALRGES